MPVLPLAATAVGLALLVWSAGRFVTGASGLARHLSMPPLLIGMLIVGFGTSAPEMLVSALASLQGVPGIARQRLRREHRPLAAYTTWLARSAGATAATAG